MQIYNCNEIENIDVESIRDSIKENAYSVIRGLFDETEIIKKRNFIEKSFNHIKDIKHDPKEVHLAKQNIQKIVIGNAEGVWRFYRKFYNPLFNDDIYEMHDVFKLLIKLVKALGSICSATSVQMTRSDAYFSSRSVLISSIKILFFIFSGEFVKWNSKYSIPFTLIFGYSFFIKLIRCPVEQPISKTELIFSSSNED